MGDLHFDNLVALQPNELSTGVWLVIMRPDRTPPHLALIAEGRWFSITYKSAEIGLPIAARLGLLMKRKVAALFIALNIDSSVDAEPIFQANAELGPGATCLDPIKQVLAMQAAPDCLAAESLHELIPLLRSKALTGITGGLNMGSRESFRIQAYSRADILSAIEALQQPNIA